MEAAALPGENTRSFEQAFSTDYLVFSQSDIGIYFPAGSLPGEEHAYIIGLEYDKLGDILHPWAIPQG